MNRYLIVLLLFNLPYLAEARKVKTSLKIPNERSAAKNSAAEEAEYGRELSADEDTYIILSNGTQTLFCPDSISFAGYEKEANASSEAFLVINDTKATLTAIKIKIVYSDLQDRMLHSRTLTEGCVIPPGETRKIDIKSWDNQHTYFYHLGNEPRKVATPYKVRILPLAFYIED